MISCSSCGVQMPDMCFKCQHGNKTTTEPISAPDDTILWPELDYSGDIDESYTRSAPEYLRLALHLDASPPGKTSEDWFEYRKFGFDYNTLRDYHNDVDRLIKYRMFRETDGENDEHIFTRILCGLELGNVDPRPIFNDDSTKISVFPLVPNGTIGYIPGVPTPFQRSIGLPGQPRIKRGGGTRACWILPSLKEWNETTLLRFAKHRINANNQMMNSLEAGQQIGQLDLPSLTRLLGSVEPDLLRKVMKGLGPP